MILRQKKFKADKINNFLKSDSFFIFQLNNIKIESWLKTQSTLSKYGLKSLKIKNKVFNKLFLDKYKITNFSQSSIIIVKEITTENYKSFINKLIKTQTNLVLIGIKEKNHYYFPNKVKKIFSTLKTKTVEENLSLNLIDTYKRLYIYLKLKNDHKTE